MKYNILLAVLLLCVSGATRLAAAPADVPQTGQTSSFEVSIATEDGDLERGSGLPGTAPTSGPRFIDNGDGTVTDNLTGLIWTKNADCPTGSQTWTDAIAYAEILANGSCGLSDGSAAGDWRLPNVLELYSLFNYEYTTPSLSNTAGTGIWTENTPFTGVESEYWSSTPYNDGYNTHSITANFSEVLISRQPRIESYYVWPVRESDSYTTYYGLEISMPGNGSGTVTAVYTGTTIDAGLNCTDDCLVSYEAGTNLTLTAAPEEDTTFEGWQGDCSTTSETTAEVTLNSDVSCTAIFKGPSILLLTVPAISGAVQE